MAFQFPGTRALRTLDAAARHLNFTRAADELEDVLLGGGE